MDETSSTQTHGLVLYKLLQIIVHTCWNNHHQLRSQWKYLKAYYIFFKLLIKICFKRPKQDSKCCLCFRRWYSLWTSAHIQSYRLIDNNKNEFKSAADTKVYNWANWVSSTSKLLRFGKFESISIINAKTINLLNNILVCSLTLQKARCWHKNTLNL